MLAAPPGRLEERSDDRAAHPELPQCVIRTGGAARPTRDATPKALLLGVTHQSRSICPRSRSRIHRNRWQIELFPIRKYPDSD